MLDPKKFPVLGDEDDTRRVFGDPEAFLNQHDVDDRDPDRAWREKILSAPVRFPAAVQYGSSRTLMSRVCVHKLLHDNVRAIFEELQRRNLWRFIVDCAGSYAFRAIRNGTDLSMHAWAAAIDFNSTKYRLGIMPPPKDAFVSEIVPVFEAAGWQWGGDFQRKDGMHFEASRRVA
jgi:hypothetical protein